MLPDEFIDTCSNILEKKCFKLVEDERNFVQWYIRDRNFPEKIHIPVKMYSVPEEEINAEIGVYGELSRNKYEFRFQPSEGYVKFLNWSGPSEPLILNFNLQGDKRSLEQGLNLSIDQILTGLEK